MQVNERTLLLPKQQAINPISQDKTRQDDDCCICLDSQVFGRTIKICKNNHQIHNECLESLIKNSWLEDRTIEPSPYKGCPLCKEPLILPENINDSPARDYREKCCKVIVCGSLLTADALATGGVLLSPVSTIAKLWTLIGGSLSVGCGGFIAAQYYECYVAPYRNFNNSGAEGGVVTEQPRSSKSEVKTQQAPDSVSTDKS